MSQTTRIPFRYIMPRQAGFGLVEIMVGMVIGLIATLVIVQVMGLFEGQKRTTSGSADAQTNGSLALYTVQRQMQQAGYALPIYSSLQTAMACVPATTTDNDTGTANVDLSPVTITDGGNGPDGQDGASDSITIRTGTSAMGGAPIKISSVTGNIIGVTNNLGCSQNDIAIATSGATCQMSKVTNVDPGHTQITLASTNNMAAGAVLSCVGSWTTTTYSVSADGNLLQNGAPIASGVVNIQAQYGISSAANNNTVVNWVDAKGGTWAAPIITDRNRIKAIRIAIVARNGQLEKTNVTDACTSWTGAVNPTGLCAWEGTSTDPAPKINVSGDANWQRYRYRVFETIVPLRNIIWSKTLIP